MKMDWELAGTSMFTGEQAQRLHVVDGALLWPHLALVVPVFCLDDEATSVEDAVTEEVRWPAVVPDPDLKLVAEVASTKPFLHEIPSVRCQRVLVVAETWGCSLVPPAALR